MANGAVQNPSGRPLLKGIVFDMDGTLIDSLASTFDAFNHAVFEISGQKMTPAQIMSYFGTGEDRIFLRMVGPQNAERAYDLYRTYVDANLHAVPLHNGIGDLLENLKSAGVPISIFTGRSWLTTELILKHHRLLDRFVTVVANDHVNLPKPSPEGLHLALSRMKLAPSEVLFVGDSPMDMQAARVAGSNGVAALWDLLANREELDVHSPKHWAEKPQQIWDLWKS